MKSSRQRRLAVAERARYARGKAPRSQSRSRVGDLAQVEAVELVERHAPGERLGSLAEQLGRRAAEHEKPGRHPRTVGQHAQQRENFGQPLDLVEDHQASKRPQLEAGVDQPRKVRCILEVEPRGRPTARGHELTGEGGLPDLPGAEQGDDGRLPQEQRQPAPVVSPMNLHCIEL